MNVDGLIIHRVTYVDMKHKPEIPTGDLFHTYIDADTGGSSDADGIAIPFLGRHVIALAPHFLFLPFDEHEEGLWNSKRHYAIFVTTYLP